MADQETLIRRPTEETSPKGKESGSVAPKRVAPVGFMQRIFAAGWYPRLPQALVLGIFVYILFALIWGPPNAETNFGTVMVWILWWPVIPLTFILLGRFWCALCPWGALSDWLQSHFNLNLKLPKVIKKYGIWVIFGGFMFITWYELAFGLTSSARATVTVLLVVAGLALITSALFEKRAWCRYLCPLGGIFGNYAQTAAVEFRGTPEVCATCTRADCYKGNEQVEGCPLFEFPKKMDSNRLCNLCGNCVKTCQNGSPKLTWRLPGKELWEKREGKLDEAVLASVLVGVILVAGFGMLEFWQAGLDRIMQSTGLGKAPLVSVAYVIFAGTALGLMLISSAISGKTASESAWKNLSRFGYALIPMNLATHISHNLFHLIGEGRNIGTVTKELVTGRAAYAGGSEMVEAGHGTTAALASPATIQILQFLVMGLGIAATVLVAWKVAQMGVKRAAASADSRVTSPWPSFLPHLVVISLFAAVSILMFALPMGLRGH